MRASPEFRAFCQKMLPKVFEPAASMVAKDEEHIPMLLVFPNGEVPAIPLMLPNMAKDAIAAIQRKSSAFMPTCLVQEAWYVAAPKEQDADRLMQEVPGGTLANHPERRECVIFSFMQGREQMLCMCDIDRDTKTLKKGDLIDPVETGSTGRFVNNRNRERMQ